MSRLQNLFQLLEGKKYFVLISPKSTGLFGAGEARGVVFPPSLFKICSRQSRALKLQWLMVYIMFYKIC